MVTRSVRDTAALLDALSGPEPGDPFVIAASATPFAQVLLRSPGRLRIALATEPWCGAAAEPELSAAAGATAKLLADLGHEVTPARPAFNWEQFLDAMTDVWAADLAHTIDGLAPLLALQPGPETLEGTTLAAVRYGRRVTAMQMFSAADVVNDLSRIFGRFFGTYDLLLTPTLGRLPAELGTYDPVPPVELGKVFEQWSPWESFLPAFNATGLPAVSLPLHTSASGLPIGIQLVAGAGREAVLLQVAAQLETALPWSERVPPIHVSRV
jgi:amidase